MSQTGALMLCERLARYVRGLTFASTDPTAIIRFHRSVSIDEAGVKQLAATIDRLETLGSVAELAAQL